MLRPVRFVPTFDKACGQSCGGVALHVVDPRAVRSFQTTVALLAAVHQRWPHEFQWLLPPYEYERHKPPIDILYGSARLREALVRGAARGEVRELATCDADAWREATSPFRLYE
jgi:uncharacterized protein YbbC (DUF1343 family)